jgi:hypothetical protein
MTPAGARGGEVQVHHEAGLYKVLATRIREPLHRALKLYCVTAETSVMYFVVQAIEEKLACSTGTSPRRRGTKAYAPSPVWDQDASPHHGATQGVLDTRACGSAASWPARPPSWCLRWSAFRSVPARCSSSRRT